MFIHSMTKSEFAAFIKDSISESVKDVRNEILSLIPETEDTEYCTIQKVAQRFKVTKATVHNWAKRKTVKKYHINGRVLYKMKEIERVIR